MHGTSQPHSRSRYKANFQNPFQPDGMRPAPGTRRALVQPTHQALGSAAEIGVYGNSPFRQIEDDNSLLRGRYIRYRQIPVREQNLEPALLFLRISRLIWP